MAKDKLARLNQLLWVGLLLALPVTSFPLIARVFGGSNVAPLSLLFLLPLVFSFLLPQLLITKRLPSQSVLLLLFFLAALFSTALGWFQELPSFRDASLFRNNLEGVLSLATGICFFLVTTLIVSDEAKLRRSIFWINIAGMLILAVSLMQALSWQLNQAYPQFLWDLQRLVSVKSTLFIRRTTGLAMEPSWLAHQLNMLFLPLWLAFSVNRRSIYKQRLFKGIMVEDVLLLAALAVLFTTLSRIGWLTAGVLLAVALFPAVRRQVRTLAEKGEGQVRLREAGIWLGLVLGGLLSLYLLGRVAAAIDPKMRAIFNFEMIGRIGVMGWLSRLSLAERFMYWSVGYQVFRLHPIIGVGLGAVGFYFLQFVPSFGYGLPEIYEVIGRDAGLPNAKNLWSRLLGETGIIGIILFALWLYQLACAARDLTRGANSPLLKTMGAFGTLALVAILLEGFSLDTFGLPYYWLSFGLLVAAWRLNSLGLRN